MRDQQLTDHEIAARRMFARICMWPESRWSVVREPEPGVWYDFACPITGRFGQCKKGEDLAWKQEPRGERPVILKYLGETRRA